MPKKDTPKYNLQICNPSLAKEWHAVKNKSLTPKDVTPGSSQKVWWLCMKGHKWEAKVYKRNKGQGCPFCSGKKVNNENCLQTANPRLAKEWHPTKNKNITPKDVTLHSGLKSWWLCSRGHEWKVTVNHRSKGHNCPYCVNQKVNHENCLQTVNPSLAKEWHPTKNGNLTPRDVMAGSNKKAWWKCQKGHEWESNISSRNNGRGCPYCAGKKVGTENRLQALNPTLAKEWHHAKNGNLTPRDYTAGSKQKVWWQCSRGHEWNATIGNRSNGSGCPYCRSKTSFLELKVFTEMKFLFHDAEHRKKIHGVECDVFIPSLNLAIEIDGAYFHKDKYEKDKKKTNVLKEANVDLIRIREKGLSRVSSHDILCKTTKFDFNLFRSLIHQILLLKPVEYEVRNRIQNYLTKGELANNEEFVKIWNMLPSPSPELSIENLNPSLAKEWHPTKNGNLTPRDVTAFSSMKVWWKCLKGHEWESTIHNRTNEHGCPYCANKKVNDENCLQTTNPSLAKEWHPTKNGSLTPSDFTAGSGKKAWWQCSKGHEWEGAIKLRNNGKGCSYCARNKVNPKNCLQIVNPTLAKEWHPTKNGSLTPRDVRAGSSQKVWWLCPKAHEWIALVKHRNNGGGCPYCSNQKVSKENCLQTINPTLAKEWHPTKNINLTPRNVIAGSKQKAWWICSKGHEWNAVIQSRNNGHGCPYCDGKKISTENCLQTLNPTLAKEWHPNKNGNLTPRDVTKGSSKKAWWQCSKGHEWEAIISNRHKGQGCPTCVRQKRKRL